jgi:hypothetical protein
MKLKYVLAWVAAAIMLFGTLVQTYSNYHLISAINPVFHNIVRGIFLMSTLWLAWLLYFFDGFWCKIGGILVMPIAAVLTFVLFKDVAPQLVIIKEFGFENYTAKEMEYNVLRVHRASKGRNHYASIKSLNSFDGSESIPITKAQHERVYETQFTPYFRSDHEKYASV